MQFQLVGNGEDRVQVLLLVLSVVFRLILLGLNVFCSIVGFIGDGLLVRVGVLILLVLWFLVVDLVCVVLVNVSCEVFFSVVLIFVVLCWVGCRVKWLLVVGSWLRVRLKFWLMLLVFLNERVQGLVLLIVICMFVLLFRCCVVKLVLLKFRWKLLEFSLLVLVMFRLVWILLVLLFFVRICSVVMFGLLMLLNRLVLVLLVRLRFCFSCLLMVLVRVIVNCLSLLQLLFRVLLWQVSKLFILLLDIRLVMFCMELLLFSCIWQWVGLFSLGIMFRVDMVLFIISGWLLLMNRLMLLLFWVIVVILIILDSLCMVLLCVFIRLLGIVFVDLVLVMVLLQLVMFCDRWLICEVSVFSCWLIRLFCLFNWLQRVLKVLFSFLVWVSIVLCVLVEEGLLVVVCSVVKKCCMVGLMLVVVLDNRLLSCLIWLWNVFNLLFWLVVLCNWLVRKLLVRWCMLMIWLFEFMQLVLLNCGIWVCWMVFW